jgi:hypothetical protein
MKVSMLLADAQKKLTKINNIQERRGETFPRRFFLFCLFLSIYLASGLEYFISLGFVEDVPQQYKHLYLTSANFQA